MIGREAFPLACFGNSASFNSSMKWTKSGGLDQTLKFKLGPTN